MQRVVCCSRVDSAVETISIPVFGEALSLLHARFSVLRWRSICGMLDESGRAIFQIHDHSEELSWNGVITKNTAVRGLFEILRCLRVNHVHHIVIFFHVKTRLTLLFIGTAIQMKIMPFFALCDDPELLVLDLQLRSIVVFRLSKMTQMKIRIISLFTLCDRMQKYPENFQSDLVEL